MPLPQTALVVGASGGLGAAIADHLAAAGTAVHRWSRATGGPDITDEASVAQAAAALGPATFDWILVATGVLAVDGHHPERRFAELDPARMAEAYAVNAIGPALLVKHLADRLPRGRPCAFAALSARLGSIGDNRLGGWMAYRAAKAGLNQILRCAAVEVARKRPAAVVVGLHPGTVETPLTRRFARGRFTATPPAAAAQLVGVLAALGPGDTGGVFDYAGAPVPF